MAIETMAWCLSENNVWQVTARARNGLVRVFQRVIRKVVIKCFSVKLIDVSFAAFVVGVTMPALLLQRIGLQPVESFPRLAIRCGFLMTIEAESGLRLSRERFMTLATVVLELGMSLNKRPGYNEFFQKALRCGNAVYDNDEHAREQQSAFDAAAQYCAPVNIDEPPRYARWRPTP